MADSFVIYRSSAGSGKTYTLVKEYLLLALKDPQYKYRHILAITFTNKAMQEMKNRIIESLAEFCEGKNHSMKYELIETLEISENEFIRRCKILLENILHEYSYFTISTIDAFFQRIIRSFTKELGLYGQYQLELDQDLVKIQAIDNLIADLRENQELTRWIVKYAEEELNDGKNWDIRKSMNNLAGEIFKEDFTTLENDLPSTAKIVELQKQLKKEVSGFRNQLQMYAAKGLKILQDNGIEIDELKNKKGGAISFFYQISKDNFKEPNERPKNACTDLNEWVKKASPRYDEIINIAQHELMPLLEKTITFYNTNLPRYCTAEAALKFIYGYGLLAELNRKIHDYKKDRDLLFIQDATKLIKNLMQENDTPFIFEKVGTFFQHYLIDEFQDTSSLQWHCLKPLVFDAISQGNKSMVVGDSKQSIYRWRGGDWSLLQHRVIQDITPHPHTLEVLSNNFRSAVDVINFNNLIFDYLPKKMLQANISGTDGLQERTIELAREIAEVYKEAQQEVPENKTEKGYVNIQFIDDKNHPDDWQTQVLDKVVGQIDDIIERGYDFTDIALLVRKGSEAAMLAQHLLSFSNADGSPKYPVLTNEALLLKNSRAVMVIINALRYMQSAKDEIALQELIFNYQKIRDQKEVKTLFHELLNSNRSLDKNILPFDIEKEKQYLMHLPIEEAVEHLIRIFGLPGNSGEEAYLQTFQDKVLEFGRAEGNDILSFLLWWDEKGVRESINVPSGLNAVSIMTIHKAKGLQFPVVMVPFTSWATESDHKTILWASCPEAPYSSQYIPVKYVQKLKDSYFKDAYLHEHLQSALDGLNILYVAFTRAENELYVFAPEKSGRNNIAQFLLNSLSDENFELYDNWSPQLSALELGEKKVIDRSGESALAEQVEIKKYQSHDWRKRLVVKKVSSGRPGTMEEAKRGLLMHHLLSKIKYRSDIDQSTLFKSIDDESLKEEILNVISHPEITAYFNKPYKVLNEKNILVGNDISRPDRIVIDGSKAVIIDYKWGQKQNKYEKQVKSYLHLLKTMGYKDTAGYLYYVDQKSVEKVS